MDPPTWATVRSPHVDARWRGRAGDLAVAGGGAVGRPPHNRPPHNKQPVGAADVGDDGEAEVGSPYVGIADAHCQA